MTFRIFLNFIGLKKTYITVLLKCAFNYNVCQKKIFLLNHCKRVVNILQNFTENFTHLFACSSQTKTNILYKI